MLILNHANRIAFLALARHNHIDFLSCQKKFLRDDDGVVERFKIRQSPISFYFNTKLSHARALRVLFYSNLYRNIQSQSVISADSN